MGFPLVFRREETHIVHRLSDVPPDSFHVGEGNSSSEKEGHMSQSISSGLRWVCMSVFVNLIAASVNTGFTDARKKAFMAFGL